jgi:hypothetical protein
MSGNRNLSIEIRISDISNIPQTIIDKYDIQFSSKENCYILWIHPDGYKSFDRKLLPYMQYVKSAYNRRTKSDHLDLFIESKEIDEYGIIIGEIKYKNIRWSEIMNVDLSKILLKKEIETLQKQMFN